jgi:hypothetical protein
MMSPNLDWDSYREDCRKARERREAEEKEAAGKKRAQELKEYHDKIHLHALDARRVDLERAIELYEDGAILVSCSFSAGPTIYLQSGPQFTYQYNVLRAGGKTYVLIGEGCARTKFEVEVYNRKIKAAETTP